MNEPGWLLIGVLLIALLLIRKPLRLLVAAVSLVVLWDFGPVGLGVFWGLLVAFGLSRQTSPSHLTRS